MRCEVDDKYSYVFFFGKHFCFTFIFEVDIVSFFFVTPCVQNKRKKKSMVADALEIFKHIHLGLTSTQCP